MFDGLDMLTPHVRAILGFMGIDDPVFIAARPMMFGGAEAAEAALQAAAQKAEALGRQWGSK
jgi:FMN-dependent NADH-azoreductase